MQREELESIAQAFLDAFNASDVAGQAQLLDPDGSLNEVQANRLSANAEQSLARIQVVKEYAPRVVGKADTWIVDEQKGTVAAEILWGIPDEPEMPNITGSVFLDISADGRITSIREQHPSEYGFCPCGVISNPPINDDQIS